MKNHPVKKNELKITKIDDDIFILGTQFSFGSVIMSEEVLDRLNEEIEIKLNLIACFTYRSTWSKPLEGTNLFSDAGWGCMIRAGQMAFYNIIAAQQFMEGLEFIEDRLNSILLSFHDELDNDVAPFSIRNIVEVAEKEFGISKGQWFRSTSILMALDILNRQYNPVQTKNISILTMVDASIILSKIHSRLFNTQIEELKKLSEQKIKQDIYTKPWTSSLMLNVAVMIGSNEPDLSFREFLDYLISSENFVGLLGGSGNRAFYIFGMAKSAPVTSHQSSTSYLYLDPHTIQPVPSLENHSIQSYYGAPFYSMVYRELNTSLAVCFHLKNGSELENLIEGIRNWKSVNKNQESFISIFDTDHPSSDNDMVFIDNDF